MQLDKDFLEALNRTFYAECEKQNAAELPDITPSEHFTKNMERMMRHKHKRHTDSAVGQKQIDSAGKACTATASAKESILHHSYSVMQIVMGTLAIAAVIAVVVGFGTLIFSLDRKPGTADSSGNSSMIATDSEPVFTTTTATIIVDVHDRMPEIPVDEQNILGGKGEIVTVTPARRNVAGAEHPVLRDDMFLYWDQYRTCIEKDSASAITHKLSKEYREQYHSLLSDGTALYYADDEGLYTIDSMGSKTLLYSVSTTANMTFTQVINLGTADGTDPWYFISGYRGMDMVNAVFDFAAMIQPATGKELDLTDRIDMSGDAQWEFQSNGTTLIGLNLSTNALLAFPRPEVMADPSSNNDIQQLWLSEQNLPRILSWKFIGNTVSYVTAFSDRTLLGEYSIYDGTRRTRLLDMPSADAILSPEKLFRVTQTVSETDSSLIDISVTMTDWKTLMDGGDELELWGIHAMKPDDVHALRAAGEDVVLFYPAAGQRALYAPFWADESN